MNEDKKRWVPVYFPKGPFKGSVNLAIKGENVVTADAAKELIDAMEDKLDTNKICSSGCSCCKGSSEVSKGGEVCANVHASENQKS